MTIDTEAVRQRMAKLESFADQDATGLKGPAYTTAVALAANLSAADVPDLLDEVQRLRAELDREDKAHADTIADRDQYQQMADQLAAAIARLTGVDIGEHSSMNNPWENALQAATEAAEAVTR
jgi:hypothetical protein